MINTPLHIYENNAAEWKQHCKRERRPAVATRTISRRMRRSAGFGVEGCADGHGGQMRRQHREWRDVSGGSGDTGVGGSCPGGDAGNGGRCPASAASQEWMEVSRHGQRRRDWWQDARRQRRGQWCMRRGWVNGWRCVRWAPGWMGAWIFSPNNIHEQFTISPIVKKIEKTENTTVIQFSRIVRCERTRWENESRFAVLISLPESRALPRASSSRHRPQYSRHTWRMGQRPSRPSRCVVSSPLCQEHAFVALTIEPLCREAQTVPRACYVSSRHRWSVSWVRSIPRATAKTLGKADLCREPVFWLSARSCAHDTDCDTGSVFLN
jgi:hypothetical protein